MVQDLKVENNVKVKIANSVFPCDSNATFSTSKVTPQNARR